ncbi:hypothetical protein SCMU_40080 [Sinomonas cyclohexanicum]|uniref:Transposase n=1 Tax=Sinomonas cyclohexanicum TaxID=322009 RepID=A0ABM7Q0R8_SINCY|nr:hypothetical protein [Corynebacterium cyclohexanicum]BCT78166.1 hypothetical protein SCMU_40080 [Corynebacterium cyclohexanicum]
MTYWRQKTRRKAGRPVEEILRARDERRSAVLAACVAEVKGTLGADAVTHALVAEHAGVPVQFVRWKYPSRGSLVALALPLAS